MMKLLMSTSIPFDLISFISSNNAQGSITTPFPIIEILFFLLYQMEVIEVYK